MHANSLNKLTVSSNAFPPLPHCRFYKSFTDGKLHCFKKVHSQEEGKKKALCRGLFDKSKPSGASRSFRSPKGCCRKGGVGYTTDPLVSTYSVMIYSNW